MPITARIGTASGGRQPARQRRADHRCRRARRRAPGRAASSGCRPRCRAGPSTEIVSATDPTSTRPRLPGSGAWRSMCAPTPASSSGTISAALPTSARRNVSSPRPSGPAAWNQTAITVTARARGRPARRRRGGARAASSRAVAALRPTARASPPSAAANARHTPANTRPTPANSATTVDRRFGAAAFGPTARRRTGPCARLDGRLRVPVLTCPTLTLNWRVAREARRVARSAERPAAARSACSCSICSGVASTSGSRTGPASMPRSRSPALTRIEPWVRKMPV